VTGEMPRPMAHTERGGGDRHLMLVHGFTGGRTDFADHLEPLAAAGWHVAAPDLRGHGETGGPRDTAAYTVAAFVDDLVAFADRLGWDRFVLLGHSMGGVVAQQFALDHPARLDALILMDTMHGPMSVATAEELEFAGIYAITEGMAAMADLMDSGGPNPLETDAYKQLRVRRPDIIAQQRANVVGAVPEMFAACSKMLMTEPDRLDRLRTVTVRTLVIVGEHDVAFVDESARMADAIADAELVTIAGSGHSPQWEQPDAWFEALATFLQRIA
jgi:pimeloyl-ACP methyl ester carboxylesterase